MPTPIRTNDIIRVRFYCQDNEQVAINTIHYACSAYTGIGATDLDVAVSLDGGLAALYKALLNNNAKWLGVTVQKISPYPPVYAVVGSNANGGNGTAGAAALPRQSAGLISLYADFGGRGGHGRMYLPFPAVADDQGDGIPTAGYVAKLGAISSLLSIVNVFGGGGNTSTCQQVIVQHVRHPVIAQTLVVTRWVNNAAWATQRRRGSFGKANKSPF